MFKFKFSSLKKEDTGSVSIIVAAAIVIILILVSMTVDYGYNAYQKSNLQNAADSAVLAGAIEISRTISDSEAIAVINDYANANITDTGMLTTITGNIDRSDNIAEVRITQVARKFFSIVFSKEERVIEVYAAAAISDWRGEALPFVNLDDNYLDDPEIVAWEKTGPGDFESIWKDDYEIINGDNPDYTYFDLDYEDGITMTKGTVATVKQEVGYVFEQYINLNPAKPNYIFSLRSDVIESGKYDNIKNQDVIAREDLVLLEVIFHDYDYTGKTLFFTVIGEYEDFNDVNPQGTGIRSELVG